MLSHYIARDQRDWDTWIPFVLMAYRGAVHSTTGYSPYFLLHGRDQVLPIDTFLQTGRLRYDVDENYVSELMARLKRVYSQVHENTERAKVKRNIQYNKKTRERNFVLGDLVYLKDLSSTIGVSKKLAKRWKGPYRVIEITGPVNYRIRKVNSREEQVVHVNRLKKYYEKERVFQGVQQEDDSTDASIENEDEEEKGAAVKIPIFPQWVEIPVVPEIDEIAAESEETGESEEEFVEPVRLRRSTRTRKPPDRLNL